MLGFRRPYLHCLHSGLSSAVPAPSCCRAQELPSHKAPGVQRHAGRSRLSKKPVIVKIGSHFNGFLFSVFCFAKTEYPELYNPRKSLLRKNFDLLRNSRPTVPVYADGRELLVFRTFLQSVSVPKRVFRHAAGCFKKAARVFSSCRRKNRGGKCGGLML